MSSLRNAVPGEPPPRERASDRLHQPHGRRRMCVSFNDCHVCVRSSALALFLVSDRRSVDRLCAVSVTTTGRSVCDDWVEFSSTEGTRLFCRFGPLIARAPFRFLCCVITAKTDQESTFNNPTVFKEELLASLQTHPSFRYSVIGFEWSESGTSPLPPSPSPLPSSLPTHTPTPHFHGHMELKNPVRSAASTDCYRGAHSEARLGSSEVGRSVLP